MRTLDILNKYNMKIIKFIQKLFEKFKKDIEKVNNSKEI